VRRIHQVCCRLGDIMEAKLRRSASRALPVAVLPATPIASLTDRRHTAARERRSGRDRHLGDRRGDPRRPPRPRRDLADPPLPAARRARARRARVLAAAQRGDPGARRGRHDRARAREPARPGLSGPRGRAGRRSLGRRHGRDHRPARRLGREDIAAPRARAARGMARQGARPRAGGRAGAWHVRPVHRCRHPLRPGSASSRRRLGRGATLRSPRRVGGGPTALVLGRDLRCRRHARHPRPRATVGGDGSALPEGDRHRRLQPRAPRGLRAHAGLRVAAARGGRRHRARTHDESDPARGPGSRSGAAR